jgi:hypothetical protein
MLLARLEPDRLVGHPAWIQGALCALVGDLVYPYASPCVSYILDSLSSAALRELHQALGKAKGAGGASAAAATHGGCLPGIIGPLVPLYPLIPRHW